MAKIDDLDQKVTDLEGQMTTLAAQIETLSEAQNAQKEDMETFQTQTEQSQSNMEQRLNRVGEKVETNKTTQQGKNEAFEISIRQQTTLLAQNQQTHTHMMAGMIGGTVIVCLLGVAGLVKLHGLSRQLSDAQDELNRVKNRLNKVLERMERQERERVKEVPKVQAPEQQPQHMQAETPVQQKTEIRSEEKPPVEQPAMPIENQQPEPTLPEEADKLLESAKRVLPEMRASRIAYTEVRQSVPNVLCVYLIVELQTDGYTDFTTGSGEPLYLMGIEAGDGKLYIAPTYLNLSEESIKKCFAIRGEGTNLTRCAVAEKIGARWRLDEKGEIC